MTSVGIVGAGLIGAGWAVQMMAAGYRVVATDSDPAAEDRLAETVARTWPRRAAMGLADGARADNWRFVRRIDALPTDLELVQECVLDVASVKRQVFQGLDAHLPEEVPIASSTSALVMTPFQDDMRAPQRLFTGHPMTPPYLMPLVEVSGGNKTDPAILDWAMAFYERAGMVPVRLNREIVGHIVNRLQAALYREAVNLVVEGIADVASVDKAVTHGPGLRQSVLGPHLAYHLAGGSGGFRRYMEHLGPSQERRWADLGEPRLTAEVQALLTAGVEAEAGDRSVADLEVMRDRCLLAVRQALDTARGKRGK